MTAVNLNRAVRGPVTAVPVVAGKGVRIVPDVENNRFVAEVDETVLWDCNGTPQSSPNLTLSEPFTNFEILRFKIAGSEIASTYAWNAVYIYLPTDDIATVNRFNLNYMLSDSTQATSLVYRQLLYNVASTTSFTVQGNGQVFYNGSSWSARTNVTTLVWEVVGINRLPST